MLIIIKKLIAYLINIFIFYLFIFLLFQYQNVFAENQNEVKVGILLGFTGVVESLTPSMADSAELAFNEISNNERAFKKIKFKITKSRYKL